MDRYVLEFCACQFLTCVFTQGYVLQYSVLFYGYYDSGKNEPYKPPPNNPDPYIGWNYKLPLAYMLMIPIIFGVCIVAILMR